MVPRFVGGWFPGSFLCLYVWVNWWGPWTADSTQ